MALSGLQGSLWRLQLWQGRAGAGGREERQAARFWGFGGPVTSLNMGACFSVYSGSDAAGSRTATAHV